MIVRDLGLGDCLSARWSGSSGKDLGCSEGRLGVAGVSEMRGIKGGDEAC